MKKLLIISETWYPDSRATISIVRRMAEGISREGIEVMVLPMQPLQDGRPYPPEADGIRILPPDMERKEYAGGIALGGCMFLERCIRSLIHMEKRLLRGEADSKWNRCVGHVRDYQKRRWLRPVSNRIRNIIAERRIAAVIARYDIDAVLSVSLPFWLHTVVDSALRSCGRQDVVWVPVCMDPYAYSQPLAPRETRRRNRYERRIFARARKIMMLSQSRNDYRNDALRDRIVFFEIPNLRRPPEDLPAPQIQFAPDRINCVFIGNLYWQIRNPEALLKMFAQFSDSRICLHIIGALISGFPEDYMTVWQKKLDGRFTYSERVSSEEAEAIMQAADVLINIGNTTSNQCPSKVMEYISTGKPIVNIARIEKCTSEPYLRRYPLSHLIREKDCEDPGVIVRTERFILEQHERHVDYGTVEEIFGDCTNAKAVETVLEAFGRTGA